MRASMAGGECAPSPTSTRCRLPMRLPCWQRTSGCPRKIVPPSTASAPRSSMLGWAICPWASRRPRSPAARPSGSSWPNFWVVAPLHRSLLFLDEPSTGLHPQDLAGLHCRTRSAGTCRGHHRCGRTQHRPAPRRRLGHRSGAGRGAGWRATALCRKDGGTGLGGDVIDGSGAA